MTAKDQLGRLLGALHRSARNYFRREFLNTELGGGAHSFLLLLFHEDGLTQHELTQRLNFDKAHTTRAIQRLKAAGYITRQRDPKDHRAYRIYLTQKARQLEPEIRRILGHWSEVISDGLSDAELEDLVNLLGRMNENARAFLAHRQVKSQKIN